MNKVFSLCWAEGKILSFYLQVYQVRLWAMTVNGTGPPTEWHTFETYESDLDESTAPGPPTAIRGLI